MLNRIRQPGSPVDRVDWGKAPVWTSGPTHGLFGGDMVIALAGFSEAIDEGSCGCWQMTPKDRPLSSRAARRTLHARRRPVPRRRGAPTGRKQRVRKPRIWRCSTNSCPSTPTASWFIQRAAADKGRQEQQNCTVSARWWLPAGGLGTVREAAASYSPILGRCSPRHGERCLSDIRFSLADDAFEIPAFLRKSRRTSATSLRWRSWRGWSESTSSMAVGSTSLASTVEGLVLHDEAARVLDEVVALGPTIEQAWLILASWVNDRSNGLDRCRSRGHSCSPWSMPQTPDRRRRRRFDGIGSLGGYPVDGWNLSRVQRLRRALGRMGT